MCIDELKPDHMSLTYIQSQSKTPRGRIARWFDLLADYDFTTEYIKGSANVVADALSRVVISATSLDAPFASEEEFLGLVKRDIVRDDYFGPIVAVLKGEESMKRKMTEERFALEDGLLYFNVGVGLDDTNTRLCVPNNESRSQLISEAHGSAHEGTYKAYLRLASDYYWPHMFRHVKNMVRKCVNCQYSRPENRATAGPLRPLQVPENRWSSISMDFITGFPASEGHDMIMVVVDRLTKRAHFIPTNKHLDGPGCAKLYVDNVVRLHGVPEDLVSVLRIS